MSRELEKHICENINCGKTFYRRKKINIYCSRKCFKQSWYNRMKEKEARNKRYPVYHCPRCNTSVQLDFDPARRFSPWLAFKCPMCDVLMIQVTDNISTQDQVMA